MADGTKAMSAARIRQAMARELDPATIRESERNERIAARTWWLLAGRRPDLMPWPVLSPGETARELRDWKAARHERA